ncbi:YgiT-type zinc finger protein [Paenibacillaceae bacterium]|nr:YgiT-type zinc finger protein [Paenibacillaceae bacterium]
MSKTSGVSFCTECFSENLNRILHTDKFNVSNKTLVIESIPVLQCSDCGEIIIDTVASQYIDEQISIFNNNGFINKVNLIKKSKKLSNEKIGETLGVTKQRVGQILQSDNLDVRTMLKLANAIDEPVTSVFGFKNIVKINNEYYIK